MYKPKSEISNNAYITSLDQYKKIYEKSIHSPENFWGNISQRLDWIEPWEDINHYDFKNGEIEWFSGGKLNASYNCLDRHINAGFGDEIAIIWEGNDPNQSRKFTYSELLKEVS